MKIKKITCTVCPIGCNINVKGKDGIIESIEGFACKRGNKYGINEFLNPVRILTSTVKALGAQSFLLPVRSNKPIAKHLLFKCMDEIRKVEVRGPVKRHDVIIPNILGTGIDIIAIGCAE